MRVTASTGARVRSRGATSGHAVSANGFELRRSAGTTPAAATSASSAPGGLLALQDLAALDAERRRRAVRRGLSLLDRLDELRRGLLDGGVPAAALRDLRAEIARSATLDEDDDLRGLLNAIDVRSAVEAAKLERTTS